MVLKKEYQELFDGLGCLSGLYHININGDAVSVRQ